MASILKQFPHLDKAKVRDLLEELDNNRQLAVQMIEEEEKRTTHILEEKKGETKRGLALSRDEENRILKESFLNLYKKFLAQGKELEEARDHNERLEGQNAKLRELNRVLLQREYSEGLVEDAHPVF